MTIRSTYFRLISVFFGALISVFAVTLVRAETMSSTNYTIQNDAMSIGGGNSTSTNYAANDALGETATGENLTSTNFIGCAGFECFSGSPFITFSVKQGTSSPGTTSAGVALGTLTTSAVTTSNGSTINSIFLTSETNATNGVVVTVKDSNTGLQRTSAPASTIGSASTTLTAGVAGYGICVFSASQGSGSPSSLLSASPYNGACTKTTGHAVGGLSTSPQNILTSSGQLSAGTAEVLVKAAISSVTAAGSDYTDTITFIATASF
jgi:hypothetical protein